VRGGGKCPEEEHTTCSGGPRIIFSQARFMGREKIKYFIKKYKIFYKKIEWFYVYKREKMVYFPLEFRVF
jgi:hypothetical protein